MLAKWKRHLVAKQDVRLGKIRLVKPNDPEIKEMDNAQVCAFTHFKMLVTFLFTQLRDLAEKDIGVSIDVHNKNIRVMFTVGQTASYLFNSNKELQKDPKLTCEERNALNWEKFAPSFYDAAYSLLYLRKLRALFCKLSRYTLLQYLHIPATKLLKHTQAIAEYLPMHPAEMRFWQQEEVPADL